MTNRPYATLVLAEAQRRDWDAIVIGAGPAGSAISLHLARLGRSVLLLDRCAFPRSKVCGGCVNASSAAMLRELGIPDLTALGAVPLRQLHLLACGRQASMPLTNGGSAISRAALDAAMVRTACDAGAHFLPSSPGTPGDVAGEFRIVHVAGRPALRARCVVVASGLGGAELAGIPCRHSRRSWIGVGAAAAAGAAVAAPGILRMACGAGGYVGIVRIEGGRINLAAAVDPGRMRTASGAGQAVAGILREAGVAMELDLDATRWHGTGWLTRRPVRLWSPRLILLGDAAGYVEPFTGEGIEWALASAGAAAPLIAHACHRWDSRTGDRWEAAYRKTVRTRQLRCSAITEVLRHPRLLSASIAAAAKWPGISRALIARIQRPSHDGAVHAPSSAGRGGTAPATPG